VNDGPVTIILDTESERTQSAMARRAGAILDSPHFTA
jgi:hypothetical protein